MVKEEVHVGDEVTATVIGRDNRRGCILLSRVEANDVLAWDKLRQLKEDKTVLNVTVKGIVSAGVIAYVEGIRGFIPASKLSLNYVEDLNEYLNKEIQVQVFDVEEEDNRLILSARELLREKAEEERRAKVSNVEVGLVTEGTVESLQPYGAFVNLGNGLSGLVHISQISEKRIKHPSAVLAVGDKVKVKVIAVKDGKLSLSMKHCRMWLHRRSRKRFMNFRRQKKLLLRWALCLQISNYRNHSAPSQFYLPNSYKSSLILFL